MADSSIPQNKRPRPHYMQAWGIADKIAQSYYGVFFGIPYIRLGYDLATRFNIASPPKYKTPETNRFAWRCVLQQFYDAHEAHWHDESVAIEIIKQFNQRMTGGGE